MLDYAILSLSGGKTIGFFFIAGGRYFFYSWPMKKEGVRHALMSASGTAPSRTR